MHGYQEYIDFFIKHWILSGCFIFILLVYLIMEVFFKSKVKMLSPQQVVNLINHEDGIVLDIRNAAVFAKGHIVNAYNINAADLVTEIKKIHRYAERPLIIASGTNEVAHKIVTTLHGLGCKQVMQLAGGIEGWTAANLPLVS